MDLTPAMLRYRECARHVWNGYFQPMTGGWHEFINVEHALFSGMVLSQIDQPEERRGQTDGCYTAIAVVPVSAPAGLPAMHEQEEPGNATHWEEFQLDATPVDMRFVEFHDFADHDDPHDFRRVRARVVGPAAHALVGQDVLLDVEHVRFETRGR